MPTRPLAGRQWAGCICGVGHVATMLHWCSWPVAQAGHLSHGNMEHAACCSLLAVPIHVLPPFPICGIDISSKSTPWHAILHCTCMRAQAVSTAEHSHKACAESSIPAKCNASACDCHYDAAIAITTRSLLMSTQPCRNRSRPSQTARTACMYTQHRCGHLRISSTLTRSSLVM